MDESDALDIVWRDGLGLDDADPDNGVARAIAAVPIGAVFVTLARVISDAPVDPTLLVPSEAMRDPAERVVHASLALLLADRADVAARIDALEEQVATLEVRAANAIRARAWADLALGRIALALDQPRVAHRRYEAVAVQLAAPCVVRSVAMAQLVELAIARADFITAQRWIDNGKTLADATDRPRQGVPFRTAELLVAHATTDVTKIIRALEALGREPRGGEIVVRLLHDADELPAPILDAALEAAAALTIGWLVRNAPHELAALREKLA